jgi:lipooligosaccharide transport system permease protein
MFFFGGTFYPVEALPGWLEPIVWAMPVTPAVHLTRVLSEGTPDWTAALALGYLLALGAIAHWAALRLMHRRLIK